MEHVRTVAPYFAERLNALADLPVVSEVRAIGLMAGVECELDPDNPDEYRDMEFAGEIDKHCIEHGLLVRPLYNMCVMSPPLTITREQIDFLADTLEAGLRAAMKGRGISTANSRIHKNAYNRALSSALAQMVNNVFNARFANGA